MFCFVHVARNDRSTLCPPCCCLFQSKIMEGHHSPLLLPPFFFLQVQNQLILWGRAMHIPLRHCCLTTTSLVACPLYTSTCSNRYKGLTSPLVFVFHVATNVKEHNMPPKFFSPPIERLELDSWWILVVWFECCKLDGFIQTRPRVKLCQNDEINYFYENQ